MANRRIQIQAGHVYGLLTTLRQCGTNAKGDILWTCDCSCGRQSNVTASRLWSGHTKSCGCSVSATRSRLNVAEKTRHGHMRKGQRSRTYVTYTGMIQRCHNPNATDYAKYGARGISVTKPWRDSFESFLNDMGERPPGMTLDRIDNRFGYFASNCRWANWHTQRTNQRSRSDRPAFLHPSLVRSDDPRVSAAVKWY